MRVLSRFALIGVFTLCFLAIPLHAAIQADCPLTLVSNNPAVSDFSLSPHGVFRSGSQVFVLRGQTLTTYTISDAGDMQIAREDFLGSMGSHEATGGTAFLNGFLYVSSEVGLEIYDLRNTRAGGSAPTLVSRTPGLHYRRLAINGTQLAGLIPSTDLPCYPSGTSFCFNTVDLFDVTNRNTPVMVGQITSATSRSFLGFNDIAFNNGFLFITGEGGTIGFNTANPASPASLGQLALPGKFLISNGTNLLAVGNDSTIDIFNVGIVGGISHFQTYVIPFAEMIDRANPIAFHNQGFIDDANGRIITMLDEINPQTLLPARTFAIDVFDFTVPLYEGSYQRIYENVSYTLPDEVKFNPVAVGPFIYTVGSMSGLQTWGACGQIAGRIEWDGTTSLNCGGAEIRGWVTGDQKVANVELFLDNGSLGTSAVNGVPRNDINTKTVAYTWRVTVNLDNTARGEHVLRAVGTDATGNRRQFASQRVFFQGPGSNCSNRRRAASR